MPNRSGYQEILTEQNLHPMQKHPLPEANVVLDGVNPSCGDEITLQLRLEEGKILEGAFVGEGCAISQASVDIMLDQIIGQDIEFARRRLRLFLRMIQGEGDEPEIVEMEEASALRDISHMPARLTCAFLGCHRFEAALDEVCP